MQTFEYLRGLLWQTVSDIYLACFLLVQSLLKSNLCR